MSASLIAGAAAPIIGGLIGNELSRGDRTAAENARKEALSMFANIQAPSVQDQLLDLQEFQSTGSYNPLLEQLVNLGPSAQENIQLDPRLRAEQMSALEQIAGMASGQPQAGDMAGFEIARRNAAAEDQAKQNQILQEMQMRGQGGSGAELMARLKSSQSSADRLQQADLAQAQAMQQAKLQALAQQASMASNLRDQDYGQERNLASAKDTIAAFNAQNAQAVGGRNTNTSNQGQQLNLQNQQNTANMNTQLQNTQQINNKGLLQQQFGNQMDLAGAKAGQYGQMSQDASKRAAQTAGMYAGVGQGVGGLINAYNKPDGKT